MAKYRKHNWQKYFKEFEQANLTQTEFCKQHDLNPKYFSQKLAQHKASNNTAFAKVSITPEEPTMPGLIVEIGGCKVHCPASMPIPSFVSLVKSLA